MSPLTLIFIPGLTSPLTIKPPFKINVAVAGIHLFDAEHLVHLHACFFLTGQASPTGNQQVGIVGGR